MKLLKNVWKIDYPLVPTMVRDLARHKIKVVVVTEKAFEDTSGSVKDYAKDCGIEIAVLVGLKGVVPRSYRE